MVVGPEFFFPLAHPGSRQPSAFLCTEKYYKEQVPAPKEYSVASLESGQGKLQGKEGLGKTWDQEVYKKERMWLWEVLGQEQW